MGYFFFTIDQNTQNTTGFFLPKVHFALLSKFFKDILNIQFPSFLQLQLGAPPVSPLGVVPEMIEKEFVESFGGP